MEFIDAVGDFKKSYKHVLKSFLKKSFNSIKRVYKKITFEEFFTFLLLFFFAIKFIENICLYIKYFFKEYNKYKNLYKKIIKFLFTVSIIGIFNIIFLVLFMGYKMYYK